MEHQQFMLTAVVLASLLICKGSSADAFDLPVEEERGPATRAYECINIHAVYDKSFADYYKDNRDEFGLHAHDPAEQAIRAVHYQAQKFAYVTGLEATLHLILARITKTDLTYDGGDIKTFLTNAAINGSETFASDAPIDLYMVITNGITDNTAAKFVCDHKGLARSQFVGNPTTTYLGARRYLFNVAATLGLYDGTSSSSSCDATARGVLEGMDRSTICTDKSPLHWTTTSKDRFAASMKTIEDQWVPCFGAVCPKTVTSNENLNAVAKLYPEEDIPEEVCINIKVIYDNRFVNYVAKNKAKFGLDGPGSATDAVHKIFELAQKYASLPGLGTHLNLHIKDIISTSDSYPDGWPAPRASSFMRASGNRKRFGWDDKSIDIFLIFTSGLYYEQEEGGYCSHGYLRTAVILDPQNTYTAARLVVYKLGSPLSAMPDLPFCNNERGGVMGDVDFLGVYSRTPPTKWSSCNRYQLAHLWDFGGTCGDRQEELFKCPPKPIKTTKRPLSELECQAKCQGECRGCHVDRGTDDYHCSIFPDMECVDRCMPRCNRG